MFASQVGNNSRPKAGRLRDEEMNDAFDGSDDKGSVINDSSASRIVDALEMVPHEEESGDGEIILGRPDA